MTLSANDRFTLIMFGLTVGVAVLGWWVRRVVNTRDQYLRDNSESMRSLTTAVNRLTERVARLEGTPNFRRRQ